MARETSKGSRDKGSTPGRVKSEDDGRLKENRDRGIHKGDDDEQGTRHASGGSRSEQSRSQSDSGGERSGSRSQSDSGGERSESESTGSGRRQLDLNSASERELAQLPMMGETRARAIMDARPFKDWDDVTRAAGFSERMIEDLRASGVTINQGGQDRDDMSREENEEEEPA